ncbi:MAG: single-stranded-DNA-specific exonuclease RecJ [Phascolarctobacterium sp.]|nr:single-stranded-DNA-specific exonuclease RecJ [Phascolarctobacterium sp.]
MLAKERIWEIRQYDKHKAGCLAAELGISPLVTGILLERGLNDTESMREFLYGSTTPFHDPFLLKDMEKSVRRIEKALQVGEKITVYGDYDVDGISASSLLYIYLQSRGAQVETYIPQRKNEGYGLNDDALQTIADGGTTLVITVDCGISGLHEVENAPKSLDIIITDHHTVPEQLPPAYAIVNAKQQDDSYPFKELSGVGIAFKLCQALEQKVPGRLPEWAELTELAALGTVADIVPLVGENRELVRRGLAAMESTQLVGLRALIEASGLSGQRIASDNIGFGLAPRLNAVGRLEHAQRAVELLVTKDRYKATEIAAELNRENSLRQDISRQIQEEAEALLAQEEHIDTAIVLASEGWHQGVIGIVASRLVDKYHLPTILLSISGDMAKGSCRSIPALNLYEAIAAEADILSQFGGHHQAAGLTLPAAKVEEFRRRFKEYVRKALAPEDYQPHQIVDCVIGDKGEITLQDLQELQLLEPCGCANMPPVFAFHHALLHNAKAMGREQNHLQFLLYKGDFSYRCIMWNSADLLHFMYDNMIADVAFQPKINVWREETSVQLHGVSIRQELNLGDFRNHLANKYQLLTALVRTHNELLVFVNDRSQIAPELLESQLAPYIKLATYAELKHDMELAGRSVVFLDYPNALLAQLVKALRQRGVRSLFLLYKQQEQVALTEQLPLLYPEREHMAQAYKLVMELLQQRQELDIAWLLQEKGTQLSENAIKIMAELGFVSLNNGIIKRNIIKRCQLEDSPLYVELQEKRRALENIYKENLRLSQYDLLRG